MRLTELEPRWIHPNIFVFLCPHCRKILLSCKNIEMPRQQQWDILSTERQRIGMEIVPTKPEQAWSISGSVPTDTRVDFITDLTVTPSIDASASGHWHGVITKGECSP